MNIPATMALLSSFKDRREVYIGYFEAIAGLGALVGPLLGSAFYGVFGYVGPFFGIGLLYLFIILYFAPSKNRLELKACR